MYNKNAMIVIINKVNVYLKGILKERRYDYEDLQKIIYLCTG